MKIHLAVYGCRPAYFAPTRYALVRTTPDRWDCVSEPDERCAHCAEAWDRIPESFRTNERARYASGLAEPIY